jgi:adenylate kinase
MKVAIIFGPPGAGKGTQCALLNSRLGFKTISTGAIIRQEISFRSELGMQVQQIVESGKLVDDDVILSCLESALKSLHLQEDSVILLDGIPRNLAQAAGLDTLLARFNGHVNKVISLQSDLENLLERFSKRWTCSVCNKVESIVQAQDISSYKCSSCGSMGSMLRRKDDDLQTAKHRFSVYQEETLPLISYYQDRGVFESIDALLSPEIVYIKAASILLQM